MSDRPGNSHEAMRLAFAWAAGERSNLNIFMAVEQGPENRTLTLAHVAMADGAEAAKWAAIGAAMAQVEAAAVVKETAYTDEGLAMRVAELENSLREIREEATRVERVMGEGAFAELEPLIALARRFDR